MEVAQCKVLLSRGFCSSEQFGMLNGISPVYSTGMPVTENTVCHYNVKLLVLGPGCTTPRFFKAKETVKGFWSDFSMKRFAGFHVMIYTFSSTC